MHGQDVKLSHEISEFNEWILLMHDMVNKITIPSHRIVCVYQTIVTKKTMYNISI